MAMGMDFSAAPRARLELTIRHLFQRCPGHGGIGHLAPDQHRATGLDVYTIGQGVALGALVAL